MANESGQKLTAQQTGYVVLVLIVAAAWLVSGCTGPSEAELDARPTERVSVEEIYVAFRDNEVAAEKRFDGNNLSVTGTIADIESAGGEPRLYLAAPHGRFAIVDLGDEAVDPVAEMRRGQRVTVVCRSVDMIGVSDPFYDLSDCQVASRNEP